MKEDTVLITLGTCHAKDMLIRVKFVMHIIMLLSVCSKLGYASMQTWTLLEPPAMVNGGASLHLIIAYDQYQIYPRTIPSAESKKVCHYQA
jgi:hypothetical protein